jgi:hypothetical protein
MLVKGNKLIHFSTLTVYQSSTLSATNFAGIRKVMYFILEKQYWRGAFMDEVRERSLKMILSKCIKYDTLISNIRGGYYDRERNISESW